jgi:hypothetical protein
MLPKISPERSVPLPFPDLSDPWQNDEMAIKMNKLPRKNLK